MAASTSAAPLRTRTWATVNPNLGTYRQVIAAHLETAVRALGPRSSSAGLIDELNSILGPWVDQPVETIDGHTSYVGNDTAPVELSFAFSLAGVRTRVLFEPLDTSGPMPRGEHRAHVRRLAAHLGSAVQRLDEIADLFLPDRPAAGPFALMHALESPPLDAPGTAPLHKVYLNPAATGQPTTDVVGAAMSRLGLGAQWDGLVDRLGVARLRSPAHQPVLFGLDLTDTSDARVKVYLRHSGCGVEEIERVSLASQERHHGRSAEIARTVSATPMEFWTKAPLTCCSFRTNEPTPSVTVHCPLEPNLPNDEVACRRVEEVLTISGINSAQFTSLARAVCGTEPQASRRLSWLGYKDPDAPVVNVYVGLDGTGGQGRAGDVHES